MVQPLATRLAAEALGTFMFFFLGFSGIAIVVEIGADAITPLGVAAGFGFGLALAITAFGHISGGHFNPAITLGLVAGKRFPVSDAVAYIIVQLAGALAAASVLAVIATGIDGFSIKDSGFAANGFDDLSPGGYTLLACLVCEVVMTAVFLLVIMGATRKGAPDGTAPIAIGLALTLIHLISIPVTNTSVNPARSTSQALFAGGDYIVQLWLFWLAPIAGGVLGAVIYRAVLGVPEEDIEAPVTGDPNQAVS
jgi:aquaporin Z